MTVLKIVIATLVIGFVLAALVLLPVIEIDPVAVTSSSAWSWIVAAMYFIPSGTVVTILGLIVAMGVWSLIVAVVKALWDVLPFV